VPSTKNILPTIEYLQHPRRPQFMQIVCEQ